MLMHIYATLHGGTSSTDWDNQVVVDPDPIGDVEVLWIALDDDESSLGELATNKPDTNKESIYAYED